MFAGFLIAVRLTGTRRLASQLKRTPSALEGFTFVAGADGTTRSGPAGSDQLPWNRYRAARVDDDLITLLLDNGSVTVLPVDALEGRDDPDDVVTHINEWIENSQAPAV